MNDFHAVNINLLRTLDAIYRHRSVSLAARELSVTQSAASHSLAQLREVFSDPLLLSRGGKTELTPLLNELGPRLGRIMADIEGLLREPKRFEPAETKRRFVVGALDYLDLLILPKLQQSLRETAPHAALAVTRGGGYGVYEALELGIMEAAMAVEVRGSQLRERTLWEDTFAVCVGESHPLAKKRRLTLDDYLAHPHALIATDGRPGGVVDQQLAELGHRRHVALTVPSFLSLPLLLPGTDLILTAPRRVLLHLARRFALRTFTPPIDLPSIILKLYWHERYHTDPGHQWLRQKIYQSCAERR